MYNTAYRRGYSRVLDLVSGLYKSAGGFYGGLSGPAELRNQSWWDRNVASPFRRARRAFDAGFGSMWHGARAGIYDGAGDVVAATKALTASMVRPLGTTATDKYTTTMDRATQALRNRAGYIRAKHDYDSATIPGKPETYDKPSYESGSTAGLLDAFSTGSRVGTDAAAAYAGVKGPLAALGKGTGAVATTLRGAGGAGNLAYAGEEALKGNYGAAAAYTLAGVAGMAGPVGSGAAGAVQRAMNIPSRVMSAPVGAAMTQAARAVPGVTGAVAAAQKYVPAAMASVPDPTSMRVLRR